MRIVVTGALGFIGSHLYNKLRMMQQMEVEAWDSHDVGANTSNINNMPWRFVDIKNKNDVYKSMAQFKPHVVFHLAAQSHVCRSIIDPSEFFETNIQGTANVMEAARKLVPGARIIHVSTDEVFGEAINGAFTESTPYAPRSPYAASKAASDHIALSYRETYGLSVTVTNCSNNFGPHQHTEKLIPMTINAYLTNGVIRIHGSGEHMRDWLWVGDHVDALIKIMSSGHEQRYVIGGLCVKKNIEVIREIMSIMEDELGYQRPNVIHTNDRPTDDKIYEVNPQKLMAMGWKPSPELFKDNLRKTIKYYEKK
jgi:dTDP-glucose 4,6-dehydratase